MGRGSTRRPGSGRPGATDARAIATGAPARGAARPHLAPGAARRPRAARLLPTGSVRFPAGTRVADLPGFEEGEFWVQDAAAALPARLLAARPGERIADLCAAPGGKTAQLAAAGASVTAVERDAGRLGAAAREPAPLALARRDRDQRRCRPTWTPAAPFDAVLLDAPCSATGTIRRHPDVPHIKRPRDVRRRCQAQDRLLDAAARCCGRAGG